MERAEASLKWGTQMFEPQRSLDSVLEPKGPKIEKSPSTAEEQTEGCPFQTHTSQWQTGPEIAPWLPAPHRLCAANPAWDNFARYMVPTEYSTYNRKTQKELSHHCPTPNNNLVA